MAVFFKPVPLPVFLLLLLLSLAPRSDALPIGPFSRPLGAPLFLGGLGGSFFSSDSEVLSDELLQEMHEERLVQKRGCDTATCLTHRLADLLSRSAGIRQSGFVATDVGAKGFGRRRRRDFLF